MLFKTFLRIFGSKSVMFSFGSIVVISLLGTLHLWLSFNNNNFNWLGAFGALLTVYSILLGFTHTVYPDFENDSKDPVTNDGQNWIELPTVKGTLADIVSKEYAQKKNIAHQETIAKKYKSLINMYYISIFGTILWAYSGFIKI